MITAAARQTAGALDSETRLATAAGRGDPRALADFIVATRGKVWRRCALLLDAQSADDLTQETYLRAFQALPRFRGDSSARTWLFSIAGRVVADEVRRRARQRKAAQAIAEYAPMTAPDPAGEVGAKAALGALAPERRRAFVLTQLLGLGYDEAGRICGCPAGTIRSRVARARVELISFSQQCLLP